MTSFSRRNLEGRSVAALLIGLIVVGALALVFAGTLTRSTTLEARVAEASAEVTALQARVDAGDAEVRFTESDAFVRQYARSIGYGERSEIAFSLRNGSPSPPAILPIGEAAGSGPPPAPFDAWLDLLFG
jgi:cell division protein FtsB